MLNILKRLNIFRDHIVESMARKQGISKDFIYYSFDRDSDSHFPHVHICVRKDNATYKNCKGKTIEGQNSLKSIASIRLRADANYTPENLQFEGADKGKPIDDRINTVKNKKAIVEWLLSMNIKEACPNYASCLRYYLTYNSGFLEKDIAKEYIDFFETLKNQYPSLR